jgi:hypothetical protein
MRYYSDKLENTHTSNFQEVLGRTSVIAFFLGMAIIAASIILGRSYTFYISFLIFSVFITFLWRNAFRPWIFLVMISAATPIYISNKMFPCNLIFALWFAMLNRRYYFMLPKWVKVSGVLVLLGFFTSSINWMSGNVFRNIASQGTYLFNMFLGPLLFLPLAFLKMKDSSNHSSNLQGLLFYLIFPSTLILISAKVFGTVANEWEASLHDQGFIQGYVQYSLGKVIVDFTRTGVGFILAALICASTAIVISPVKAQYRLCAGACLFANIYLLFSSGSFGSIFSCFCGLLAIFFTKMKKVSIAKALGSVAAVFVAVIMAYNFLPPSTKDYLDKRYEHRVVEKDTDRFFLWSRAIEYFYEHPEGVGFTLTVGDKVKSNPHNDYLAFAVSYGLIGVFAYPVLIIGLLIYWFKNRNMIIEDNNALALTLAGQGVIVAFALNSMTDNIVANRWYFNVIWSLIWYTYFCSRAAGRASPGVNT